MVYMAPSVIPVCCSTVRHQIPFHRELLVRGVRLDPNGLRGQGSVPKPCPLLQKVVAGGGAFAIAPWLFALAPGQDPTPRFAPPVVDPGSFDPARLFDPERHWRRVAPLALSTYPVASPRRMFLWRAALEDGPGISQLLRIDLRE